MLNVALKRLFTSLSRIDALTETRGVIVRILPGSASKVFSVEIENPCYFGLELAFFL